MGKRIRITAGDISLTAELNDSTAASSIWDALPVEARGSKWGDEIYFTIPVSCPMEHPRETVEVGDLGYWPDGSCFCIFFGPTPMSKGTEIRPASAVEIFGRVEGDAKLFRQVNSGAKVVVEKVD